MFLGMRGMMGKRHDMNRKTLLPQRSNLVATVWASRCTILLLSVTAVWVRSVLLWMIRSRGVVVSVIGTASVDGTMVELIHLRLGSATTVHVGVSSATVHVGRIFWCSA